MTKSITLLLTLTLCTSLSFAQTCDCQAEFSHIKNFMEKNYAGFQDKKKRMTEPVYQKLVKQYTAFSKGPHADEKCLFIITRFLDAFKDSHVYVVVNFDAAKKDSLFISRREIIPISDQRIAALRRSKTFEGIYNFHDSSLYKIAVIKDPTPLHDYLGIIISSSLPDWKRGMIKFEAKMIKDSLGKGVLHILNHQPKQQYFQFNARGGIGGDWQREGTTRVRNNIKYEPVASIKLSDKTLYIKISSFDPSNARRIDSIFKANAEALKSMPNLVLDLRGNSGGADYAFMPLMPYVYTSPFKTYGVDLLSTDQNISGWKKYLEDKDMPEERKASINHTVQQLENHKGQWVSNSDDRTIANYTMLPRPSKVAILIDEGCASTTEQFLLFARESSKVTLMGQNTSGTLDYSNVIEAPFYCMPYILRYSSSRSRRLDHGQGIDDTGIKPAKYLATSSDWIAQAVSFLEK